MMGTFSTNVIFDEMSRRRCLGIRDISSKITFVENVPMPRQNTFSERKCRVIFDEMSRRRCLGIRDISSKITFVENVPMPRQNTFSERKCHASGVWAV